MLAKGKSDDQVAESVAWLYAERGRRSEDRPAHVRCRGDRRQNDSGLYAKNHRSHGWTAEEEEMTARLIRETEELRGTKPE